MNSLRIGNCIGEGTAIDIRDENFNIKKIVTVPDCYVIPGGSRPFAFAADKSIFLQTLSLRVNDRYAKVFKYDANLNLKWEKKIEGTLFPIQIIATSDNGILFACIELDMQSNSILKLYKFNADGNIISTTNLGTLSIAQNLFYPNPFQHTLTLNALMEQAAKVAMYDITGRAVGIFALDANQIHVGDALQNGVYIAQVLDNQGKVIGVQRVLKQ